MQNNVRRLSHKAEICLVMMLSNCVHTLFNWSVVHTCLQGRKMENVLISMALVLKQEMLNAKMMHSNQSVY